MLPMRFFRNRTFALANVSSLFMFFGMFGSIFLLAQFFQTVQGYSPLGSGLRILPWTAMPIFVAPIAGALSDRIGGHILMGVGLLLQASGLAWIAAVSTPTTAYSSLVIPFILSGAGHGAVLRAGRDPQDLPKAPAHEPLLHSIVARFAHALLDLGFVGIPAFGWMRDVVIWIRGVSLVGGARAVVVGTPFFR